MYILVRANNKTALAYDDIEQVQLAFNIDDTIEHIFRRDIPKMLSSLRDRILNHFIAPDADDDRLGPGFITRKPKANPSQGADTYPLDFLDRYHNRQLWKTLRINDTILHKIENVSSLQTLVRNTVQFS